VHEVEPSTTQGWSKPSNLSAPGSATKNRRREVGLKKRTPSAEALMRQTPSAFISTKPPRFVSARHVSAPSGPEQTAGVSVLNTTGAASQGSTPRTLVVTWIPTAPGTQRVSEFEPRP
jgi:hypothetical protein